jgi:nucleotide-binding universal stress UspA family protein
MHTGDKLDIMPPSFRPSQIEEKYSNELIASIPSDRYSVTLKDREGRAVFPVLQDALKSEGHVDFVVMGHHGRKGPKSSPTSLGSNTDLALRGLHVPCLIVKRPIPRGPRSFVMCVDDSELSRRGLDILLRLVNPRDSLLCVHFPTMDSDPAQCEAMQRSYEEELEIYGPIGSSFRLVEKPMGKAITHAMVDFVNDSECDLFAIAPRARHRLSSISDYVVNHVQCSVMLCKN